MQLAAQALGPEHEAVAREVASALTAPKDGQATPLVLLPLVAAPPPRGVAAVDGSNADVLKGPSFTLAAYRAGYLVLEAGRLSHAEVPPPRLALVPPDAPPEARAESLRARVEQEAARAAAGALEAGDVLLLDGPVRDGALLALTAQRGVSVVGVSKSTRLLIDGVPAVLRARREARAQGLSTFACEVPVAVPNAVAPVFLARLSAAEPWVFRVDVAPAPGEDALAVVSRVAGLAAHPAYPGYPSPLAMIHNRIVIDDPAQRELAATLRRRCEDLGVGADAWEIAFTDYHDIIELGA